MTYTSRCVGAILGIAAFCGFSSVTGIFPDSLAHAQEIAGRSVLLWVAPHDLNPNSGAILVDKKDATKQVPIAVANFRAENGNVAITELPITFAFGTSPFKKVVKDIRLKVDGKEYKKYTVSGASSRTATATFLFKDPLVLPQGKNVEVMVMVDLRSLQDSYKQGETISASITPQNVDSINATSKGAALTAHALRGGMQGPTFNLFSKGGFAELFSRHAQSSGSQANYEIEFYVTALKTDVLIAGQAMRDSVATSSKEGAVFSIETYKGAKVTHGNVRGSLQSNAPVKNGMYLVKKGEIELFTLKVWFDPAVTGIYQMRLNSFGYHEGAKRKVTSYHVAPPSEFVTGPVRIR